MRKLLVLLINLCTSAILIAQPLKDTIVFNNGSVVIGELKKVQLGVLTFDPDDANDITVQLRKIKSIAAQTRVFRIETVQDHVVYGILAIDRNPHIINVIQRNDTVRISVEDISTLYPYDRTFLERFSGNTGIGYSYTKSSGFGRVNFNGGIFYFAKKEEIKLNYSGIYTITDSGMTRDREDVNLKYNYFISPTSFATTFLAYQRNEELGLKRRYQQGLGLGNKFITSKFMYAWARSGLVLNQEINFEDITSGTLAEVFAQLQFNLFRFTKPELDIDFSQSIFFGLTQKDRIRYDGEIDINWEMINDLNLNIGFYTNFDNQPPGTASRSFDYGMVLGLNYKF